MFFNKFEIITRDLIIVIFQLREGFFMIFHELIDMKILSLF
jgi:hypothetical protein